MNKHQILEITKNPKYIHLVKTRSRFSWLLTLLMLLVYFGFIYIVAFHKDWLAIPIGNGVTTLSIPIGLGVIIFTIIITNIYIRRANTTFDDHIQDITKEITKDQK
jgi:uncharacterized membrane protein (DUF485 family)